MSNCVNDLLNGIKGDPYTPTKKVITNITEAKGKAVVMFSDGSYMEADLSLVDECLCEKLTKKQADSIKELTDFRKDLENNLEAVKDLGGKITHYVIKKQFIKE